MNRRAFTLIELLIVVAIIAILAAIAVPNFLEAQTRSKVSRVKADMRSLDTALKAYCVDYNRYPYDLNYAVSAGLPMNRRQADWSVRSLFMISTPVAYLTTANFKDPFITSNEASAIPAGWPSPPSGQLPYYNLGYGPEAPGDNWGDVPGVDANNPHTPGTGFVILSYGPDKLYEAAEWITAGPDANVGSNSLGLNKRIDQIYDTTNGTISDGDIVRVECPGIAVMF